MTLKLHLLTQFSIVEAFLSSTQLPNIQAALGTLSKRSWQLLENLNPNHAALLQNLLQSSEVMWRDWKKNKCQPAAMQLPAPALEKKLGTTLASTTITRLKTEHPQQDFSELEFLAPVTMAELVTISSSMRLVVPSIQCHLEEYVEALDPEAGIDEEYSPKRDKVLGWQALRLFSVQHLAYFDQIRPNGDFENLVRKVYQEEYGVLIPGDYLEHVIQPEIDDENEIQADCAPTAEDVAETVEVDGPDTKGDDEVDNSELNKIEVEDEKESPDSVETSDDGENAQPQDNMVLDGNAAELQVDDGVEHVSDVKMADEVTAVETDIVEEENKPEVVDAAVTKVELEKDGNEPAPVAVAHSPAEPDKPNEPVAAIAGAPVEKETKVAAKGKEKPSVSTEGATGKGSKVSGRDTKTAPQSDQDEASLRRKMEAEARERLIDQRKRKRGGDAHPGDRRTQPPARDARDPPRGAGARSGDARRGPPEVGIQRNGPGGRGGGSGGPIATGRGGPRGPPPPHGGRGGPAMPPSHQQGGRGHHTLIAEVNLQDEVVGMIDAGVRTEEEMTRVSATTDEVVSQTMLDVVGGIETTTNGDSRTHSLLYKPRHNNSTRKITFQLLKPMLNLYKSSSSSGQSAVPTHGVDDLCNVNTMVNEAPSSANEMVLAPSRD
ncbi:THO complex subunit 1 transcription elongation factor [Fragilaria crotonensis]|nr:THO complex subunit 1 transcription elongation factor [Fragilaria crotonensis]